MKKLICLTLVLSAVCGFSGCASMFEREYYRVSEYVDDNQIEDTGEEIIVQNYVGLVNAITRLVSAHQETAVIRFSNYEGDSRADLSIAFEEVRLGTAIGAFSVDYMSLLSERLLVSFQDVDLSITYKRTAEEVENIISLSGGQTVGGVVEKMMDEFSDYLTVKVTTSSLNAESVLAMVEDYYYANPDKAVAWPRAEVNVYPDTGIEKIFEISIDFGQDQETLFEMRRELEASISSAVSSIGDGNDAERAYEALRPVFEGCRYSPLPSADDAGDEEDLSTTYAAAVLREADSEAMAMYYKAVCDRLGIECQLLTGKMNKEHHVWNIIKIGEDYYHVDPSMCGESGVAACFLRSDSDIWGEYVWDTEMYVPCEGSLTYYDVVEPVSADLSQQ